MLDALLAANMEKISKKLVNSGRNTVLDRSTVGQGLKEIEFQMSGLVNDAEGTILSVEAKRMTTRTDQMFS